MDVFFYTINTISVILIIFSLVLYGQVSNGSSGRDYGGGGIAAGIGLAIAGGCVLLASLIGIVASWLAIRSGFGNVAKFTLILYLLPIFGSIIYYLSYLFSEYKTNRNSNKWYELSEAVDSGNLDKTARLLRWNRPGSAVLKIATENGDIDMMKVIIKAKVKDLNDALKTAIKFEQLEALQLLFDSGANVNHLVRRQSILTLASTLEIARTLVDAGCNPDAADKYGETILMTVTENNQLEIVNYLLALNVDTQTLDDSGQNVLHYANFRYGKIIQALLDKGVSCKTKDENGLLPLHTVWQFNHGWDQGIPKSSDNNSFDPWQGMRSLVKCTGSIDTVDDNGETILMKILEHKFHHYNLEFLFEMGANVNAIDNNGQSALFKLQTGNDRTESGLKALHYLLEQGASVNLADNNGNTVLHIMANEYISKDYIAQLLSAGADSNLKNKSGLTAFIIFMQEGERQNNMVDTTLIRFLKHGADISITDNKGNTPLMIAIEKHHPGSTDMGVFDNLIKTGHGYINNLSNLKGETALMLALQYNRYEITSQLIDAGADIKAVDKQGNNLFHHMFKNTYFNASYLIDIIKILINIGASPTLLNKQGLSAFDLMISHESLKNQYQDQQEELKILLSTKT